MRRAASRRIQIRCWSKFCTSRPRSFPAAGTKGQVQLFSTHMTNIIGQEEGRVILHYHLLNESSSLDYLDSAIKQFNIQTVLSATERCSETIIQLLITRSFLQKAVCWLHASSKVLNNNQMHHTEIKTDWKFIRIGAITLVRPKNPYHWGNLSCIGSQLALSFRLTLVKRLWLVSVLST